MLDNFWILSTPHLDSSYPNYSRRTQVSICFHQGWFDGEITLVDLDNGSFDVTVSCGLMVSGSSWWPGSRVFGEKLFARHDRLESKFCRGTNETINCCRMTLSVVCCQLNSIVCNQNALKQQIRHMMILI